MDYRLPQNRFYLLPVTHLGDLARVLVVTTQQTSFAISSTVGTTAIDGSTIKPSDIDKLVQARVIEILGNVVAAAGDPSITAAAPADKEAAIQRQTTALLAAPSNATGTTTVATLVGINNAAAVTTTAVVSATVAPVALTSLRSLNLTDASNWFSRHFTTTALQNTPDTAGNVKFVGRCARRVSAQVASCGSGKEPRRQSDDSFEL